jgi:hypothetical protein
MDQTELRRFGSPGLTIDVSGGGPSAGPAPSDGWVWLSDEGRSEIRRFFNGRPIRPLVRASMEHKYPLDLVTNVRIENMTIGGHIGAVWTAGFSTFRVRVLGTTTVDRSTNFRASYSEFDVFSSYFLEDSVLDANRARQMIGYYGLDLTFRDLRVVGDLNVSGDRLSFTDVRVDGKYEVSDASEGHDNEFGSPL